VEVAFMVDKAKVEQAIRLLLEGIGEDVEREGLKETPNRIARMCEEIYGGLDQEADEHLLKQFEVGLFCMDYETLQQETEEIEKNLSHTKEELEQAVRHLLIMIKECKCGINYEI